MEKFKNNKYCKICGGSCCKSMGCHLSPEDVKNDITYENLKLLLETQNYSIDWWESYGEACWNGYFIRMRNKNAPIIDPSWGGECILFTERGCPLSFEDRPKGGRMLEAKHNKNGRCRQHYDKYQCATDWFEYHDILSKLVDYYS